MHVCTSATHRTYTIQNAHLKEKCLYNIVAQASGNPISKIFSAEN